MASVEDTPEEPSEGDAAGRRSSGRSLKRKKFDDEVVSSDIGKRRPIRERGDDPGSPSHSGKPVPGSRGGARRPRLHSEPSLSIRESEPEDQAVAPWPALDDFRLVTNVQQVGDLSTVFQCVKFSKAYTLRELKERWYHLLYDPAVSRLTVAAIASLDADDKAEVLRTALWSSEEEDLVRSLGQDPPPRLSTCEELLRREGPRFLVSRTAADIYHHWRRLKDNDLLVPERVFSRPLQPGVALVPILPADKPKSATITFQQAEENIIVSAGIANRHDRLEGKAAGAATAAGGISGSGAGAAGGGLGGIGSGIGSSGSVGGGLGAGATGSSVSGLGASAGSVGGVGLSSAGAGAALPTELARAIANEVSRHDRNVTKRIRRLEHQVDCWRVLAERLGLEPTEFDKRTLATIRGKAIRFKMRAREIVIGRNTSDEVVDVNLAEEGPALRVSRRHCTIKLKYDGHFYLYNVSRHPVFVNGVPILGGARGKIPYQCVLDVGGIQLLFSGHINLLTSIIKEAQRNASGGNPPR
eukprot:m.184632 g.184632  ORF g.184632 m.184632 type:complete len:527 (+) comp17489_c0_seq4:125-1705(+)